MRKTLALTAVLILSAVGLALDAFAQSPVFKQRIELMQAIGYVDRRDGGITVQFSCVAQEGVLRDGGTWPLKFDTAGPFVGGNANQVLQACAADLQRLNLMDGGE